MQQFIHDFQNLLKEKNINMTNDHLKEILYKFIFIFYPDIQTEKGEKQYESNSKIIIIDECIYNSVNYYIIGFDYKIIILPKEDKTKSSILHDIFFKTDDCDKYFIENCKMQSEADSTNQIFFKEIQNFSTEFEIRNGKRLQNFWNMVVNCLSGLLIKKGYQNSLNRHDQKLSDKFAEHKEENRYYVNKSYIELRNLGQGSGGIVNLIYYIPKEEIFALKIPHDRNEYLNERERNNYLKIRYPFIVPYIGYIKFGKNLKYLLLEYVEGKTLDKYDLAKLSMNEKYNIIFELLLSICYLHSQNYIYRDFKYSNIMINQNKDAILIDFDCARKVSKETENEEQTNNFDDLIAAPEKYKTYKSDVYSLGCIIHFILYGKVPKKDNIFRINENFIFKSFLEDDPTKRPDISEINHIFYNIFLTRALNTFNSEKEVYLISLLTKENIPQVQFYLGSILLYARDINKAIHYFKLAANQNYQKAQYRLGNIYYDDQYVTRDINKAIHYFTLAANQNNPEAQHSLGVIYYDGQYATRDIDKAIHYFTLAANQNNPEAQHSLGVIYYDGQYVTRDINKAIHYFTLAANQNNPEAQCILGAIYYKGQYVTRDIDKAIHYFTLAANQNNPEAQHSLGVIYSNCQYVTRDIDKATHYFTLAANQNNSNAQIVLGYIYYKGLFVKQDIKKGKYLIMLASINNNRLANFAHGFLLHDGKYVKKDMSKAIHYYKESSSFNHYFSKNNLGIIYKHGYEKIEKNIGLAIEYFKEAIRQSNDYLSMYNLAHIYMYNELVNQNLNKSIDLLIRSMNKFIHSFILLCLALLKKFSSSDAIKKELKKRTDISENTKSEILVMVAICELFFKVLYESYQYQDFLYNMDLKPVLSSEIECIKEKDVHQTYPNAKELSPEFYKGFGEDI